MLEMKDVTLTVDEAMALSDNAKKRLKTINEYNKWDENFEFNSKTGYKDYWWSHLLGAKSGKLFDTLLECKTAAFLYWLRESSKFDSGRI